MLIQSLLRPGTKQDSWRKVRSETLGENVTAFSRNDIYDFTEYFFQCTFRKQNKIFLMFSLSIGIHLPLHRCNLFGEVFLCYTPHLLSHESFPVGSCPCSQPGYIWLPAQASSTNWTMGRAFVFCRFFSSPSKWNLLGTICSRNKFKKTSMILCVP